MICDLKSPAITMGNMDFLLRRLLPITLIYSGVESSPPFGFSNPEPVLNPQILNPKPWSHCFWVQGGSGRAHGMKFMNARMNHVDKPVVINQFYCDAATPCANQVMVWHSLITATAMVTVNSFSQ